MSRFVASAVFAAALSGCAFAPQSVTLSPSINTSSSQVGGGRDLLVNVVDERPKKTLGTVAVGGAGADISIVGDLVESVRSGLSEGISKKNFKPTASRQGSKSELRVEIRNLDYIVIRGFWAGTLRVDAGLKAICIRDGQRPYEKFHHGEFVESVQVVQREAAFRALLETPSTRTA